MRRFAYLGTALAGLLALSTGCSTLSPTPRAPVPRLVQVDDGLYRGGQPSPEGIHQLARMGIKTIVDLRRHSREMDAERALAQQLGMRWVNIPVWAFGRPSPAQIREFLALAEDPANRPIFVHCRLGENRAGLMAAIYRIVRQGWTPRQAFVESRRLGAVPWNPVSRKLLFYEIPRDFPAARAPETSGTQRLSSP